MRFVDLFAGLGGFHLALERLHFECIFASEKDEELQGIYRRNFPNIKNQVFGDIRLVQGKVPPHDVLCAGFPCQPFSKSGSQKGKLDKAQGTLFYEVILILTRHRPEYVILENVGNFERHDKGQTWAVVKEALEELGYEVRGTTHVGSGGPGLLSPHHLGFPHSRERFFVVARQGALPANPFPPRDSSLNTSLTSVIQKREELSDTDLKECALSYRQIECIEHWNKLIQSIPEEIGLPSFPIWGDEMEATYPYEETTPYYSTLKQLVESLGGRVNSNSLTREELLDLFPRYARQQEEQFPIWKRQFIRQNREWFKEIAPYIPEGWVDVLRQFPPSLRKLEWNCKGEERDLWKCVLQFRPSGLRAKRPVSIPALVAMTATQIPILGSERRFITRKEGLRLQGFPDSHEVPKSRNAAFRALGNAVHVDVVEAIARRLFFDNSDEFAKTAVGLCSNADQVSNEGSQYRRALPALKVAGV